MSKNLALVTGASSGIGRSLADELAARGYDLIINSASQQLDIAAAELRQSGVEVTAVRADLATERGSSSYGRRLARSVAGLMLRASMPVLVSVVFLLKPIWMRN